MDISERRAMANRLLEGYVHGPGAGPEATRRALARVPAADVVVLVEGISDQIAVETLAARFGRSLDVERVVVLPTGGVHAMSRFFLELGPGGAGVRLAGLCDAGEEQVVRRGLAAAGLGSPATRLEMASLGFYVCVDDLEDELIRSVGASQAVALIESQGDLGSFRHLQLQPQWRGEGVEAQLRRFFGSGSTRKLRYARLLAGSVGLDSLPPPLAGLLWCL